jgi:hypothetical protein
LAGTPARAKHPVAKFWRGPVSALPPSQALLGLLVAIATGILLFQSREQALQEAEHEPRSLSLTLADQAERAFEAVDLVQTTFMEMVRNDDAQTVDDFRRRMSSLEVNRELTAHGAALPQLDIIGLVDSDGKFINISHNWPVPGISIADRAYFEALEDNPDQTTVVSDPLVNRVNHTLAVVVSHRIATPDGRFLGIGFAGVLMSYFENLYKTVVNNENTAISLLRSDGMLLARYPEEIASIGKIFDRGSAAGRLRASGTDNDMTLQTSRIHGTQSVIAAHALAHYPMLVTVSTKASSVLAAWREQAAYLVAAAGLLELVLAGVGVLTIRQLRGQRMLADARAAQHGAEAELALGRERERADRELRIQAARFGAAPGQHVRGGLHVRCRQHSFGRERRVGGFGRERRVGGDPGTARQPHRTRHDDRRHAGVAGKLVRFGPRRPGTVAQSHPASEIGRHPRRPCPGYGRRPRTRGEFRTDGQRWLARDSGGHDPAADRRSQNRLHG